MAKRYQKVIRIRISKKNKQHNGQKIPKGNQNPCIEEEQTTQWPRYTKSNQNPYIEEEQTTQWPKNTKR